MNASTSCGTISASPETAICSGSGTYRRVSGVVTVDRDLVTHCQRAGTECDDDVADRTESGAIVGEHRRPEHVALRRRIGDLSGGIVGRHEIGVRRHHHRVAADGVHGSDR